MTLPERGQITTFSRGAARRLRHVLAQMLNTAWSTAILATLTYPVNDIDLSNWQVYKKHLDRFTKAFRREYPNASGIWRLEFTERGFPHFHFVIFGIPDNDQALSAYRRWHQETWFRVVGTGLEKHLHACGNAVRVTSVEGARNYVAKYVSKQSAQCTGFTGRYWGRINQIMLPLAPLVATDLSEYQAVLIARVMRKVTEKQVNGRRWGKVIKDCSRTGERGWTRLNAEFAKSLVGKTGDAVRLVGESWADKIFENGKSHEVVASIKPIWHHYFPEGVSAAQVVGEETSWVVSDRMLPRNLKAPKKYKAKNNDSATYLGNATNFREQLHRYLDTFANRPQYRRFGQDSAF